VAGIATGAVRMRQADLGWTISEACEEFERAGLPVDPARFSAIIRHLPGFRPLGEVKKLPGSKGGRGDRLYPIADLQRLHSALAPWLTAQDADVGQD
jgi:hypothetical protein